jgi:ketosteroid isomerase-like protein
MNQEEQLITDFYTCFQRRDWKGMLNCYAEDVFFYDPVFENLDAAQARAMWEMLLSRAKNLELQFGDIVTEAGYGSCQWVAAYTFTATGRKVVNKGKARFSFEEGKIAEHQDDFSLWKWSSQALGLPGLLFGWTSLLQKKIRRNARKSLEKFINLH